MGNGGSDAIVDKVEGCLRRTYISRGFFLFYISVINRKSISILPLELYVAQVNEMLREKRVELTEWKTGLE